MCKHILFNRFTLADLSLLKKFNELTYENDGYGCIIRTSHNTLEAFKALDLASFYMDLSLRVSRGDVVSLVVHHRTSTNSPGIDYAHPFEFEGHYLTHNGVVSVPGKHTTKTKNDSEALLHHLIKSDYETKVIQGYFSCFVLSRDETTVLVDDTAPLYTDGRVYCSHALTNEFTRLTKVKLTLDPISGIERDQKPVELTKSDFGRDLAHLSLGHTDDLPETNVEYILSYAREKELSEIYCARSVIAAYEMIAELGMFFGLQLTKDDIIKVYDAIEGGVFYE